MKSKFIFQRALSRFVIFIASILSSFSMLAQQGGAIYQAGPTLMRAKIFPPSTLLDNGKVISFGGREFNFVSCSYADMYDPGTNSFTEAAMNYPHDGAATVKLSDGRYFLLGGAMDLGVAPGYATTEMYDPVSNTFISKSQMTMSRCNVSGAQLNNGKVLVVGAWYNTNGATYGEVYDTAANTFVATGALIQPRAMPLVLPTDDGGAVIAGGYPSYGGAVYTAVEYYQTPTNDFVALSAEVIPTDPGWLLYPVNTKPFSDLKLSNGKYILLASRGGASGSEFALITFDPATKLFAKVNTLLPLKDSLTDGGFLDLIVNKADNFVYLMGIDSASDPNRMSLITVNLTTGEAHHPTTTFTMPNQEYFYASYTFMPASGKILVQGINSTNTGYFTGTDKTYILTPQIVSGIQLPNSGAGNGLKIYPNPAQNNLFVEVQNSQPESFDLKMVDMLGRILIHDRKHVRNAGSSVFTLSTDGLAPGVYHLKISSKGLNFTERILIAK